MLSKKCLLKTAELMLTGKIATATSSTPNLTSKVDRRWSSTSSENLS